MHRQILSIILSLGSLILQNSTSLAQPEAASLGSTFPNKPIRMVVPFATGGFPDTVARLMATKLTAAMGHPFVVANQPGAGGLLAGELVARAPADGYTLLVAPSSFWGLVPLLHKTSFNIETSFAPVARFGSTESFLCVTKDITGATSDEIIASLKRRDKIYYGSPGVGSTAYFAVEAMKVQYNLNLQHIGYRGAREVLHAMQINEVSMAWLNAEAMQMLEASGDGRVIGIAKSSRSTVVPNVPTLKELGFRDLDYLEAVGTTTIGALAPAGTPKVIVDRLATEMRKAALDLGDTGFEKMGMVADPALAADFQKSIETEIASFKKAADILGIQPQ